MTERLWEKATDLLQQGELELSYAGGEEEESRALDESECIVKKVTFNLILAIKN